MGKVSEESWKDIELLQSFPLIGSNLPHQGNGYHDRMSFDVSRHMHERRNNHNNWLFSVYFRDLSHLINPTYRKDRGNLFHEQIDFKGYSSGYMKTLNQYCGAYSGRREVLLELIGNWGEQLIYSGRVIYEFVSWFDNDTKQFYGFELKRLDEDLCKVRRKWVYFYGKEMVDGRMVSRKIKIPIDKCIIIDWPESLGGFRTYKRLVKRTSKLYSVPDWELHERFSPEKYVSEMRDKKISFNRLIRRLGTNHFPDNTSEFYRQCLTFRLKLTTIRCTLSVLMGTNRLLEILNRNLMENATIDVSHFIEEEAKFQKLFERWLAGDLSFKEANKEIKFW